MDMKMEVLGRFGYTEEQRERDGEREGFLTNGMRPIRSSSIKTITDSSRSSQTIISLNG